MYDKLQKMKGTVFVSILGELFAQQNVCQFSRNMAKYVSLKWLGVVPPPFKEI